MRRRNSVGMTLVEVTITIVVVAVSLGGFSMAVLSTQKSSIGMGERGRVRAQAMKYMERLQRLPFGSSSDAAATADEVAELFDDNSVVTGGTGVTLRSLETPVGSPGWRFRVEGFECRGVFEVEIDTDLDGNGTSRGLRGPNIPTTGVDVAPAGDGTSVVPLASEGSPTLLRIEIFFNGESVIRALRCAPVEGT
jgi:hypothetical protein